MKTNLLLLAVSSTVGILLAFLITRPFLSAHLGPGASYRSTDELRKAISERDERDVKPDGSVSLRSIIEPHPSETIIYHLKSGLDVKFLGKRLQTNSLGMRGPEILDSPAYRIALLGDSFAFGWGVEYQESFAYLLGEMLSKEFGQAIEVLNYGVPGYSTFQEVSRFEELGIWPDLVLLYFVDNDFGAPFFIRDFSGVGQLTRAERLESFRRSETEEVKQEANKMVGLLNPNTWLRKLSDLGKEHGFQARVAFNPHRGWKKDRRMLPLIDQRSNLEALDMRAPLLKLLEQRSISSEELTLDGDPHPSPIMHLLLAEILAEKLRPEVELALR